MDLNIRNATSDYLVNEYGFEINGSSIPKNDFNYYKRNFYLWIFKNVNKKLFYFLRDKVSAIKYIKERDDKSLWFSYKLNGKTITEIQLQYIGVQYNDYSIKYEWGIRCRDKYNTLGNTLNKDISSDRLKYKLDAFICKIEELKPIVRERSINKILNY